MSESKTGTSKSDNTRHRSTISQRPVNKQHALFSFCVHAHRQKTGMVQGVEKAVTDSRAHTKLYLSLSIFYLLSQRIFETKTITQQAKNRQN